MCIEEPENGVDTLRLDKLALMLKDIATDFSDPQQQQFPLRQLLVSTHSPQLISQPAAINALLFTHMATRVVDKRSPLASIEVTIMDQVVTAPSQKDLQAEKKERFEEVFTLDKIKNYLKSENTEAAYLTLKDAQDHLIEGIGR